MENIYFILFLLFITTCSFSQIKNVDTVYLDKNDPIFISIKGRAVSDLKQTANPESPGNKLIAAHLSTWSEEKLKQFEAIFVNAINDYNAKTHFEPGTFFLVFKDLAMKDQKELTEDYDIRVQYLDSNKYVAEFWEDGISLNSEAHALAWAQELAKRNPEAGVVNVEEIKNKYVNVRKSIEDGKKERYTKVMALLYTIEKDRSLTFNDPFQPLIDFK